jgi:hypothetical protein
MTHLILDDGRGFWRSNLTMSGVYHRIALAIDDSHSQFKRWLFDMSNRCAPCMDFDLRGLPKECRLEFHRAAKVAFEQLTSEANAGRVPQNTVDPLQTLVRMKESMDRGEPPLTLSDDEHVQRFNGFDVDLDEIWDDLGGDSETSQKDGM